jgi:hypothetical protein
MEVVLERHASAGSMSAPKKLVRLASRMPPMAIPRTASSNGIRSSVPTGLRE